MENSLILVLLWIHIFFAIIFIGGSYFMWLVLWPASFKVSDDEKQRTRFVGVVAKRFAYFSHTSLLILVVTGLILAFGWYLPQPSDLITTLPGHILLTKMIVVAAMIGIVYVNNLYHGKRIMRLSREGKKEELQKLRRKSHILSFISLGLMALIVILAVALQIYG
ncbi:MAG: CopD family protein [Candidatus Thermoplasmatota archaeon]|nr:CopD family protein [Candidatus Thermoplasmatota archaeon]